MNGPVDVLFDMRECAAKLGAANQQPAALRLLDAHDAVDELIEANKNLVQIINAAGLIHLSSGVQLGATSWYVKASDAMKWNERALVDIGAAK